MPETVLVTINYQVAAGPLAITIHVECLLRPSLKPTTISIPFSLTMYPLITSYFRSKTVSLMAGVRISQLIKNLLSDCFNSSGDMPLKSLKISVSVEGFVVSVTVEGFIPVDIPATKGVAVGGVSIVNIYK